VLSRAIAREIEKELEYRVPLRRWFERAWRSRATAGYIGTIVLVIFYLTPGTLGFNRFGDGVNTGFLLPPLQTAAGSFRRSSARFRR